MYSLIQHVRLIINIGKYIICIWEKSFENKAILIALDERREHDKEESIKEARKHYFEYSHMPFMRIPLCTIAFYIDSNDITAALIESKNCFPESSGSFLSEETWPRVLYRVVDLARCQNAVSSIVAWKSIAGNVGRGNISYSWSNC